jgi:hypothetical protein
LDGCFLGILNLSLIVVAAIVLDTFSGTKVVVSLFGDFLLTDVTHKGAAFGTNHLVASIFFHNLDLASRAASN